MTTTLASANYYWQYIEKAGLALDSDSLSRIATNLKNTSWDNPTSATCLNNFAVVALIQAEECHNSALRRVYVDMALEALKQGVELYAHPLCAAHLALVLAMTGEIEQAMQTAFSAFINTLQPAYIKDQHIPPCIVYLPPANAYRDSRSEKKFQNN